MQFLKAKNGNNKLLAPAASLFAIDNIELLVRGGFVLRVMDIQTGYHSYVAYCDRESFDKEWEVLNCVAGIGYKKNEMKPPHSMWE